MSEDHNYLDGLVRHIAADRLLYGMIISVSVHNDGILIRQPLSCEPWIITSFVVDYVQPNTVYDGILQPGDRIFAHDDTMFSDRSPEIEYEKLWKSSCWYVWRSDDPVLEPPVYVDTVAKDIELYGPAELLCAFCGRRGGHHVGHVADAGQAFVHPNAIMFFPWNSDFRVLQKYFVARTDGALYGWTGENSAAYYDIHVEDKGLRYPIAIPSYTTGSVIGVVPRIRFLARTMLKGANNLELVHPRKQLTVDMKDLTEIPSEYKVYMTPIDENEHWEIVIRRAEVLANAEKPAMKRQL